MRPSFAPTIRQPSQPATTPMTRAGVLCSIVPALLVVAVLGACATPVILLRNETTGEIARCGGNTIGSMQGRSTEQASDAACAREYEAKGFRRTNEAEEKLRQRRSASSMPAPKVTVPVASRWLLSAEQLARANGCATPLATLTEKTAGQERFAIVCADATPWSPVVCDFDGCRIGR